MSETINVPRTLKKQPLAIRVIAGIAKYIFLLIIVAISIGPIIWAALSSFKTMQMHLNMHQFRNIS